MKMRYSRIAVIVAMVVMTLFGITTAFKLFSKPPKSSDVLKAQSKSSSLQKFLVGSMLSFGVLAQSPVAFSQPVAHAVQVKSVFSGSYDDPNHPGCMRKIVVEGKDVTIIGSDKPDGSNQFKIKAKEDYPGTIFVDFSPKGGPKDLLGSYNM